MRDSWCIMHDNDTVFKMVHGRTIKIFWENLRLLMWPNIIIQYDSKLPRQHWSHCSSYVSFILLMELKNKNNKYQLKPPWSWLWVQLSFELMLFIYQKCFEKFKIKWITNHNDNDIYPKNCEKYLKPLCCCSSPHVAESWFYVHSDPLAQEEESSSKHPNHGRSHQFVRFFSH